jgi:DNA modification methylase
VLTDRYALYNGDACEVLKSLPTKSVHLCLYSPPFATESGGALYNYSSSERDLSNSRNYDEFFEHYEYIVRETERLLLPGRIAAVHCMDVPRSGERGLIDFPGDIIRLHERCGFWFWARHFVWKEPLGVRNRTMARGLAHRQVVEDASLCDVASADCLLLMRKKGNNPVPITHQEGLLEYAGEREVPHDLRRFRGWTGKQRDNQFSHWIWRQYASAFWDDVRLDRVLPYVEARDDGDERHQHPLQLDVIDRVMVLRSNPGETVLSPFMGVGSEVYGAVVNGRRGIGVELKPSYYRQAVRNLERTAERGQQQDTLFPDLIENGQPIWETNKIKP